MRKDDDFADHFNQAVKMATFCYGTVTYPLTQIYESTNFIKATIRKNWIVQIEEVYQDWRAD